MRGWQQPLLSLTSPKKRWAAQSEQKGDHRRAKSESQRHDYAKCAEKYPNQAEWDGENLWIKEGTAVLTNLYLKGLWQACEELGGQFVKEALPQIFLQTLPFGPPELPWQTLYI